MEHFLKKVEIGVANFLNHYGYKKNFVTLDQARSLLDFAFQSGINKIDSAARYGKIDKLFREGLDKRFEFSSKLELEDISIGKLESYSKAEVRRIFIHNPESLNKTYFEKYLDILRNSNTPYGISIYHPEDYFLSKEYGINCFHIPYNILDGRFSGILNSSDHFTARSIFLQGKLLHSNEIIGFKDNDLSDYYQNYLSQLSTRELLFILLYDVLSNANIDRVVLGFSNIRQLIQVVRLLSNKNKELILFYDSIPKHIFKTDAFLDPRQWILQ